MFTYYTDDVYALTLVYANPHSSNVTYTPHTRENQNTANQIKNKEAKNRVRWLKGNTQRRTNP